MPIGDHKEEARLLPLPHVLLDDLIGRVRVLKLLQIPWIHHHWYLVLIYDTGIEIRAELLPFEHLL